MSNMQDRVLQLIQLIQFRVDTGWSVLTVTNNFIGDIVKISSTLLAGFEMMGFNVELFTQDSKQEKYYFTTDEPIPFPDCSYQYQWAKYGRTVIPPNTNFLALEKGPLNGAHRTTLCEFLKIDLAGNFTSSLSRGLIRYIDKQFGSIFDESHEFGKRLKHFEKMLNDPKKPVEKVLWDLSTVGTKLPLSIFLNLFHQRFLKNKYLES